MKSSQITITFVLSAFLFLWPGSQAFGELGTVDAVPAATLLLPHFAVDIGAAPGTGLNTLFEINNASAAPALAHVTVWTDWSVPVLDFDVFLTGFDVQTVNLFDVFMKGWIPVTADEQSDQGQDDDRVLDPFSTCDGTVDSCSPHGENPQWDGSFDGSIAGDDCLEFFPFFVNPLLSGTRLTDLQASLTGKPPSDNANCNGADHGDDIARGYITVDSVNGCSIDFPNDEGYFTDGVNPGIANNLNVLWGYYYIVDPGRSFAGGDALVHVEADDAYLGGATGYTFYSRYTSGFGTLDGREALGESWAARYLGPPIFDATELVVWRDSTSSDIISSGCGAPGDPSAGPSWHPLNETEVVAFDEVENAVQLCAGGGGGGVISPPLPGSPDPACFPLESQLVRVDGGTAFAPALATPYDFGWLFLNLDVGDDSPTPDFDPVGFEFLAQSFVGLLMSANAGAYNVGLSAIELTAAEDGLNPRLVPDNNIEPLVIP
ncbi:MAG: hypothetical protein MI919_18680 [Holophagales bacterium]|nr:hypothetical protein [Holophagales bacterium]